MRQIAQQALRGRTLLERLSRLHPYKPLATGDQLPSLVENVPLCSDKGHTSARSVAELRPFASNCPTPRTVRSIRFPVLSSLVRMLSRNSPLCRKSPTNQPTNQPTKAVAGRRLAMPDFQRLQTARNSKSLWKIPNRHLEIASLFSLWTHSDVITRQQHRQSTNQSIDFPI